MATEEVKIFFKVDGLDGYITDLNDLENALGQVTDETKQATQATKNLEQANEMAAAETERRLDVLEGGVKLLAGSAEFAAGAFALLGEEGNEFFEATEKNVLGVLALGRGLIDITEGYRLLKQNLALAKDAQRAFNTVAKANPYVLLASALIAAAGAFLLFKLRAKEAQDQVDASIKAYEQLTQTTREKAQADIDAIETQERLRDITAEVNKLTDEELKTRTQNLKDEEEAARLAIIAAKEKLEQELEANAIIGAGFRSLGFVEKAQLALKEAQDAYNDTQKTTNAELTLYNNELERRIKLEGGVSNEENTGTLDRIAVKTIEVANTNKELMVSTANVADEIIGDTSGFTAGQVDKITNFTDTAEYTLENFARNSEQIFGTLADLNEIFVKDDEKRAKNAFEIQKKASLAQAIISGALAINKAFASQIIPNDPTSILRAIGASVLAGIKTAAQIAVISRQQFNSPTPGSVGGGGGATLNYQVGGQQAGGNVSGQFSGGAGGTGGATQTYVLAGNVTSQQEAEAQIQNLARL